MRCAHAHPQHRRLPCNLLLPLRHSAAVAYPASLHRVRSVLQCWHVRRAFVSQRALQATQGLVTVRLLLPCSSAPFAGTRAYQEVHLWLPPARYHLPRRLRCLRYRSAGLLSAVSRYHQRIADSRLQLPLPHLPRVRPSSRHGLGLA